jgi:drug/metabolite transporter (DMT)-like permease
MNEDQAKRRFFVLSLLRLCGVALAFLGVAIIAKRWIEPADIVGAALILIGAVDVLVLPRLLARRWRTPPEA